MSKITKNYTGAPWTLTIDNSRQRDTIEGENGKLVLNSLTVQVLSRDEDKLRVSADLQLMSSAPKMIDALLLALEALRESEPRISDDETGELIEDAIIKVRGALVSAGVYRS